MSICISLYHFGPGWSEVAKPLPTSCRKVKSSIIRQELKWNEELLDAIAEKYNRPHRKTNDCTICGKRLNVVSESDRWTNCKPRFKYVCPGYRKKTCNFKAVDGVLFDELIVQQLFDMSYEDSERFKEILEIKIGEVLEQSSTTQEYTLLKRKREKLQTDIVAQTRNMREVDENIRCYLQDNIQAMSEKLRET